VAKDFCLGVTEAGDTPLLQVDIARYGQLGYTGRDDDDSIAVYITGYATVLWDQLSCAQNESQHLISSRRATSNGCQTQRNGV